MIVILAWAVSLLAGGDTALQDPTPAEILQAIHAKDYTRAERLSLDFTSVRPQEAIGWFYLGHSRAAQRKFSSAIEPYQQAIRLGLKEYKSHYQLGYSAHRAGLHTIAASALGEALALQPESPDALYYLGVTQYELVQDAEAERTLSQVMAGGGRWVELARFHRALARRRAGRRAEAEEDLRWIVQEGQSEDLRNRSRDLLRQEPVPGPPPSTDRPPAKAWSIAWMEKAGYDSNALFLPETSLSRSTEEGDFFLMTFVSGALELAERKLLSARLNLLDLSYVDLTEFSLDAALASLESQAPLTESLSVFVSGHGDLFYLDRESLFQRVGARAGARFEPSDDVSVVAGGLYFAKDFRQEALDDLDGAEKELFVEVRLKQVTPWLQAGLRYQLHLEDAEAGDRSYLEHRLWARLEATLAASWKARVEGGPRRREYDEEDRFYLETREDRRAGVRVTLTYLISERVHVFAEFEAERNDSNISDFDYDREMTSLGILLVF